MKDIKKYPDIATKLEPFFVMDERLAKNVSLFIRGYITDSRQIDFFSSQLLGVNELVLTDGHIDTFLKLFNMSMTVLNGMTNKITDIDKNFKVQRESLFIFIGSILHLIEVSKIRDKRKFQKDVIFFMVIRMFTSRYNHDFKTLRPPEASKQVYNNMSNAFDIKKYKTNLGVLLHKVDSIYSKNVYGFKANKTATYARFVIDARGKTISYIQGWWTAYNNLADANFIETTTSLKSKAENGDDILRDVVDIIAQQNEAGLKLLMGNMIDKEILDLVHATITPNTPVHLVEDFAKGVTEVIADKLSRNEMAEVKGLSDAIVSASVNYIYNTKLYPPYTKNIIILGKHIRVIWKSSNIQDANVKYVKRWLEVNVFPLLKTSLRANKSTMTSFLCYFYLLTVVKAEA